MSGDCKCNDPTGHAKAVESAVFQSLLNAKAIPDREEHWFRHADKLERKFITAHGRHYGDYLYKEA